MSDTLLAKVAEFLDREDITADEVSSSLLSYQRKNHPDRFHAEVEKVQAGERFKKAGELAQQWKQSIERTDASPAYTTAIERVIPPEQALQETQLEVSTLLRQNYEIGEELERSKWWSTHREQEVENLKKQMADSVQEGIAHAQIQIVSPYQPRTKTIAVAGISGVLGFLYVILGQVEIVANRFLSPLGLSSGIAGIVIFATFIVTVVGILRQNLKALHLRHVVAVLCTTDALCRFIEVIQGADHAPDEPVEFTERDVVKFVRGEVKGIGVTGAGLFGLRNYSESTIDEIKNLIIGQMIAQKLIEIGPPHGLQRLFRTKIRPKHVTWTDAPIFPMKKGVGAKPDEPRSGEF